MPNKLYDEKIIVKTPQGTISLAFIKRTYDNGTQRLIPLTTVTQTPRKLKMNILLSEGARAYRQLPEEEKQKTPYREFMSKYMKEHMEKPIKMEKLKVSKLNYYLNRANNLIEKAKNTQQKEVEQIAKD